MLTGRYQAIPGAGEFTTPSTGESMVYNLKADYMAPFLLTPGMEESKRKELNDRINALRIEGNRREGLGQNIANWTAGMVGSILNPYSLLTGEALGAVAKPVISRGAGLIGRYAPSQARALLSRPLSAIIGKELPEFISKETVGSLTSKGVSGFAQATGFALPGEIANTYNPETDAFNWYGGIKASFEDGGLGLALMSAPYFGGVLWGKVFKGRLAHTEMPLPGAAKKSSISEFHIDDAVKNKKLTAQEGQWFKDYLFKGDTSENLSMRATEMLIKDGHPVDASTNRVMFKILHPEDVNHFQTALADSIANKMPENVKSLYQEFIGHNSLDNLRNNPDNVIDGLRGVVNFTRKRLEKAPEEVIQFHKVVRRLLPEALKEENPFTQHKIYRAAKAKRRLGITHPEHVEKLLKHDQKVSYLKNKIQNYGKDYEKTGKNKFKIKQKKAENRLQELEEKRPSLLSHADEMKHLREKLLPEGQVAKNFKSLREYGRLLDLTRVRNDARTLMHELHLTNEHELHEAYATLLDALTKVMRSEFGKFAKVENVNDYMRERIIHKSPEFKNIEIATVKKEVEEAKVKLEKVSNDTKSHEGQTNALKVMDEEIKESSAKEVKKEYDTIKSQMDEFKNNESVFSDLIRCVLGAANV